MPKREDVYNVTEYTSPEVQLHRHAPCHTQEGDVVVVDVRVVKCRLASLAT